MLASIVREYRYLLRNKCDFIMAVVIPPLIIFLLSSMLQNGKPEHLPIAIIDQDYSQLSYRVNHYLSLNNTLEVKYQVSNIAEAEKLLNQTKIWGYVHIPNGAEKRLVQSGNANISIAFNQSFFTIGNSISSAMLLATASSISEFTQEDYLRNIIPHLERPTPNIKVSILYNPDLSNEFFLAPFLIPAILHLLLCCCITFSIGQEFKRNTFSDWATSRNYIRALLGKIIVYVSIFTFWTWLWMIWLVGIKGWFIAGSLILLLVAQVLFYFSYALIAATIILATKDLSRTFGFMAIYGGSSLSFAGVTLPLNNAPSFTKFWSTIIPYTPYANLQTEQWVIGSDPLISIKPFLILVGFCLLYFFTSVFCIRKITKVENYE